MKTDHRQYLSVSQRVLSFNLISQVLCLCLFSSCSHMLWFGLVYMMCSSTSKRSIKHVLNPFFLWNLTKGAILSWLEPGENHLKLRKIIISIWDKMMLMMKWESTNFELFQYLLDRRHLGVVAKKSAVCSLAAFLLWFTCGKLFTCLKVSTFGGAS